VRFDRRRFAWFLLLVSPAMFSVNILAARYAVFVPPNALALGRWAFVALFLLPFAWKGLSTHRDALWREWPDLLLLGALGMWICGAWVYIGARTTSALNIGLIYAASPILVVVLGRIVDKEPLSKARASGIALCLAGVAAVFAKGRLDNLLAVRFTTGDLWVIGGSASWGLYSVLLKHRPSRFDPTTRLCAVAFAGCAILIPFTIGESLFWAAPDLGDWRLWITWLVMAIVPGVGAYTAYSFCIQELGPSRTSISLYLGPPYVGLMAWVALGEAPQWYHLIGIALVLPGLFLATRPSVRRVAKGVAKGA
jgi:drug/metabolite transporter (DMT)-like permease